MANIWNAWRNWPREKNYSEFQLIKIYSSNINEIYKRIQIELGLPVNVTELQKQEEKPLVLIDLIREANKAIEDAKYDKSNKKDEL